MDERTEFEWQNQTCKCGNDGWCGRDSHRPDFAVDDSNSTIFFDKNGKITDGSEDGWIQLDISDIKPLLPN